MRLVASDCYILYRPSPCELRVYLHHRGVDGEPRSAFEEVIERLGRRHEEAHFARFSEIVDLRGGELEQRRQRTLAAVVDRSPALYQPILQTDAELAGVLCEVVGEPDFILREGDGYVIRDSKLARRITQADHPEIIAQMSLYGWLFEKTFSEPPRRLEVHSGSGALVEVEYDQGVFALTTLERIVATRTAADEPYSPVGWTKCGACRYNSRCWAIAARTEDIARVAKVDQGLAIALRGQGVTTPGQLIEEFDEARLSSLRRPWGQKEQRVGKQATRILTMARVLASGRAEILQTPQIPTHANYVMFDLEGLPPFLDELDKVYLWGMKVCGNAPYALMAAVAGFGPDGDRQAWLAFLEQARQIFEQHGDVPFVHWHHYERTKLLGYVARYGDRDRVAERVKGNLLDLLPIAEASVALPIPSYSLKVIEKYVGFRRTLDEAGGDWAMATFIEATETHDASQRDELLGRIRAYNEEDLDATWAVFQWLQRLRTTED